MSSALRSALCVRYAQFLLFFGMKARALEFLELAAKLNPRNVRVWNFSAFLYAESGRFDVAASRFERALELNPDPDVAFNLGFALQRMGKHELAIERFQCAIDLNPNMDRAWYGAGISLVKLGRHADAVPRFSEAARIQYFNPYAGYQLAAALFKLGEHEKVREEYERVSGFDPKVGEQMRVEFGIPKD